MVGTCCSLSRSAISLVLIVGVGTAYLLRNDETEAVAGPPSTRGDSSDSEAVEPARSGSASRSGNVAIRTFRLDYRVRIPATPPGVRVQVWIPLPPSNLEQQVTELPRTIPGTSRVYVLPKYGNRLLHIEIRVRPAESTPSADGDAELETAGKLATSSKVGRKPIVISVPYRVVRREVHGLKRRSVGPLAARQRRLFLGANRMVPIDGKPVTLLGELTDQRGHLETARRLYQIVDDHVAYRKEGQGWGRGDVSWVCDSGYGNCTDFHSLFISLARASGIPARFEIGFPLPNDRHEGAVAGYHCWAYFYLEENGWVPVDISEADKHPEKKDYFFTNLNADRVAFSTGRDITLVPPAHAGPLNFFIYPHVEFDGKPVGRKDIHLDLHFRDED